MFVFFVFFIIWCKSGSVNSVRTKKGKASLFWLNFRHAANVNVVPNAHTAHKQRYERYSGFFFFFLCVVKNQHVILFENRRKKGEKSRTTEAKKTTCAVFFSFLFFATLQFENNVLGITRRCGETMHAAICDNTTGGKKRKILMSSPSGGEKCGRNFLVFFESLRVAGEGEGRGPARYVGGPCASFLLLHCDEG